MASSTNNFNNSDLSKLVDTLNNRNSAAQANEDIKESKRKKLQEKTEKDIAALRKREYLNAQQEIFEQEKRDAKAIAEAKIANAKAEGKIITAAYEEAKEKLTTGLTETVSNLTSKLDSVMASFISAQESMAAHLSGTSVSLNDITDNLNSALAGQGFVKQEAVYAKLSDLLNRGIVYNVEQRAFLQTLASDMNLIFDATDGSLTRLIRLQSTDLSSYRMAIEYDLQKFLNENYATSEYIRDVFSEVSGSLLETQSLLSATSGIQLESTLQTILGSYYSLGASKNTISGLAQAINALGSGDISGLGSGISNLILMGVAQAGLDYGSLLNNGVNSSQLSAILNSTIGYMSDMYNNSDSNVVKSQLAKVFGVTVSDLVAANKTPNITGAVSSDISNLLGDASSFMPASTMVSNLLSNFWYSWGTNIASNPVNMWAYEVEKIVANTLGDTLMGFAPGGINLGYIAKAAPILTLLPTLVESIGNVGSSLSDGFNFFNGLSSIFDALGTGGSSTMKISQAGVSGSIYLGNGDSTDILNNAMSSVAGLAGDTVTGTEEENEVWKDDVSIIRENIVNMYDVLQQMADEMAYSNMR